MTTDSNDKNALSQADSATSDIAAEDAAENLDTQGNTDTVASGTSADSETAVTETLVTGEAGDTEIPADSEVITSGETDTGETITSGETDTAETIVPEMAEEGSEAEESQDITVTEAETSEPTAEMEAVSIVTVPVADGTCLKASDIPEIVPEADSAVFSHWEDAAGKVYSSEELMTIPVYEDTVYYALLTEQEDPQQDQFRIGSRSYATLAEAFQAVNDGSAEASQDGSYAVVMQVSETTVDQTASLEPGHEVVLSKAPAVTGEAELCRSTSFIQKDDALIETAGGSSLKIEDIVLDGSGIRANNAPIIHCRGSLVLSGNSQIRNNLTLGDDPAAAGAIWADGGEVTMEDHASIHDCIAGKGASAVYLDGDGSHFLMTGGSITGNQVLTGDGGFGAVYAGSLCESQLNGGSITGNRSAAVHGGFFNDGGRLSIGGGITITGNRASCVYADDNIQDQGTSMNLELGNGEPFSVESPLTGKVGITSPGNMYSGGKIANSEMTGSADMTAGTDFGSVFERMASAFGLVPMQVLAAGTVPEEPAEAVSDEVSVDITATNALGTENLFSDAEESMTAVVEQASGDIVLFAQATSYVCKIGNTGYTTLQDAVNASTSGAVIELLKDITLSAQVTISGKNITITKAAENAAVLPYEGTAGSTPQIIRAGGYSSSNLLFVSGASGLMISHVCMNGNNVQTAGASTSQLRISGGSTVTLDTGSSIVNANGYQGGAVYIDGASTFLMQSDSKIRDCSCRNSGAVDVSAGSTVTMKGTSSIQNCTATSNGTSSAVFMRLSGSRSTLNITENASITGNTSLNNGAESTTICMHQNAGIINISGSASITGNTGAASGAVLVPSGCTLNMTGGSITGNTVRSSSNAVSGAIGALSGATVNLSGNPVISGNSNEQTAAQKDLYLATNALLKITGNLDNSASVGIFCPNYMTSGSIFGNTAATLASSVSGLDRLFNDNNTGSAADLYGTAETGSHVVWGRTVYLGLDKKVTGNMGDRNQAFSFSIVLKSASGTNLSGGYSCFLDGSATVHHIVFTNGIITSLDGTAASNVQLKSGERILISGLPYGVQYTVTELADAAKGYTVSHTITDLDIHGNPTSVVSAAVSGTAAQGSISDISRQVDFLNQRSASVPTGIHDNIPPFLGMIVFSLIGILYSFTVLFQAGRKHMQEGK
ncbi:MAG: hypothetical protein LKJ76_06710 [Lachnospiraceae bacterium]|nr:hypothetical protein [Lachnospiraceae bacterium]